MSEMEADSSGGVTLRPHIHFLPNVLSRRINPAIKLEAYRSLARPPSFTSELQGEKRALIFPGLYSYCQKSRLPPPKKQLNVQYDRFGPSWVSLQAKHTAAEPQ